MVRECESAKGCLVLTRQSLLEIVRAPREEEERERDSDWEEELGEGEEEEEGDA